MRADGTGAPTMGAGDAFILSALGIGTATAQSAPRKGFIVNQRTFLDSCPPGHRIRFQSDTMSLHVDPRLFDSISIGDLATVFENRCPLEAVLVPQQFKHGFFFGRAALAAANTPTNLGSSFFRLITGFVPRREDKPFPGGPREAVQQPSVFHVQLPIPEQTNSEPPSQVYELRYPDDGMGSSTIVRVSCSGGGPHTLGKRSCFTVTSYDTPYRYRGVLSVIYDMSHPHSAEGAIQEREAVLAFDMRIRAWIDSMMIYSGAKL